MNTMQERLQALLQTLRNPLVPPNMKGQLRQLIKMTHTNLMQMQMLAAQGIMFGAMAQQGMAANMPGMMMMNPMAAMNGMGGMAGMPGMDMQQQMPQHQGHQGHHGHHGGHHGGHGGHGGRGGFRGGFRGRGFRGGMRGVRRQAEDQMGGPEKMQRVS